MLQTRRIIGLARVLIVIFKSGATIGDALAWTIIPGDQTSLEAQVFASEGVDPFFT
jgi:hypothetical protein